MTSEINSAIENLNNDNVKHEAYIILKKNFIKRKTIQNLILLAYAEESIGNITVAMNYYRKVPENTKYYTFAQDRLSALEKRLKKVISTIYSAGKETASNKVRHDAINLYRTYFSFLHLDHKVNQAVGRAHYHLKNFSMAAQFFEQATLTSPPNESLLIDLSKAYYQTSDIRKSINYAKTAYEIFKSTNTFNHLKTVIGKKFPRHWIVIGDSHVRYFKYLQKNSHVYWGNAIYLEAIEFGGATAYGLKNSNSQSGARSWITGNTQKLKNADMIILNFGEVDCRRAVWKAANDLSLDAHELIIKSAENLIDLATSLRKETNSIILIIGAKPQIINDSDFHSITMVDYRTTYKSLDQRHDISLRYNRKLEQLSRLKNFLYLDLDGYVSSCAERKIFYDKCFFNNQSTDTHGNLRFFADLYFNEINSKIDVL